MTLNLEFKVTLNVSETVKDRHTVTMNTHTLIKDVILNDLERP